MPDHVHLIPTKARQHLVNQFKGFTSLVLRQEQTRTSVLWSKSYSAGSVGHVSEETVRKYIKTQEQRS